MDILGIGFPELILIFIIALMVFGPRRLPEIAVKLGKTVADLRNMSQGLMTEWQREITVAARVEELEKTRQEFDEIKKEVQQAKKGITAETISSVNELAKTRKELEDEIKAEPQSSPSEAAAEASPPVDNTNSRTPDSTETKTPSISADKPEKSDKIPPAPPQSLPPTTSPAEVVSE